MARAFSDITFTPTVRAIQTRQGSADAYAKYLAPEAAPGDRIGPAEAQFIAARDGFFQATVSETGWPYVQFRGGPAGFLKVLDDRTIGYADYRGNRQYLSVGNLTTNDRVALILMDYPNRRRLKLLGRARIVERDDDPDLVDRLYDTGYKARPERAVLITVAGMDWNCQQHIPQRLTLDELEPQIAMVRNEMARLQQENATLRAALAQHGDIGTD